MEKCDLRAVRLDQVVLQVRWLLVRLGLQLVLVIRVYRRYQGNLERRSLPVVRLVRARPVHPAVLVVRRYLVDPGGLVRLLLHRDLGLLVVLQFRKYFLNKVKVTSIIGSFCNRFQIHYNVTRKQAQQINFLENKYVVRPALIEQVEASRSNIYKFYFTVVCH